MCVYVHRTNTREGYYEKFELFARGKVSMSKNSGFKRIMQTRRAQVVKVLRGYERVCSQRLHWLHGFFEERGYGLDARVF